MENLEGYESDDSLVVGPPSISRGLKDLKDDDKSFIVALLEALGI